MKYEELNRNHYMHEPQAVEYAEESIEDILSQIQETIDEKETKQDEFVQEDPLSEHFGLEPEMPPVYKKSPKKPKTSSIPIESVLNLRTFLLVASATLLLGFYIHNVITVNRLAGETEYLRQKLIDQQSVNVVLESKLQHTQRIEKISKLAGLKLGLEAKAELPELIEMD
jgi:cell division protein FtsL